MRKLRRGDPRSTARWRRLAERVRIEGGSACERCGSPAKEVHHRRPLHLGGAPFDRGNLALLCAACHQLAHSQERSKRLSRIPGRAEALEALDAKLQAYNPHKEVTR